MASPRKAGSRFLLLREEDIDLRVAQQERQTLRRRQQVEADVGAARLQDREQGHDHLQRAVHQHAHRAIRADADRAEMIRKAVRAAVQLAIRQSRVLVDERDGVGRRVDLILEETVHRSIARIGSGGGVPLDQELVGLGIAQEA